MVGGGAWAILAPKVISGTRYPIKVTRRNENAQIVDRACRVFSLLPHGVPFEWEHAGEFLIRDPAQGTVSFNAAGPTSVATSSPSLRPGAKLRSKREYSSWPAIRLSFSGENSKTVGYNGLSQVTVPVIPELSATKNLAGACGGQVVFPDIQTRHQRPGKGRGVREFERQVQIPDASTSRASFGLPAVSSERLQGSRGKAHGEAPSGGKEAERVLLDCVPPDGWLDRPSGWLSVCR